MKLHPFSIRALLCSAHVPKRCKFIGPLALIQQFLIALFVHFRAPCHAVVVVVVELRKNVPGLPNIGFFILGFEVGHYQAEQ